MSETNVTLTRAHLAAEVSKKIGLSTGESSEIVDLLFDEITDHFIENDDLKIVTFGSFHKNSKKERVGRNPKTKKEAIISARKVVTFNPSRVLKAKISQN